MPFHRSRIGIAIFGRRREQHQNMCAPAGDGGVERNRIGHAAVDIPPAFDQDGFVINDRHRRTGLEQRCQRGSALLGVNNAPRRRRDVGHRDVKLRRAVKHVGNQQRLFMHHDVVEEEIQIDDFP